MEHTLPWIPCKVYCTWTWGSSFELQLLQSWQAPWVLFWWRVEASRWACWKWDGTHKPFSSPPPQPPFNSFYILGLNKEQVPQQVPQSLNPSFTFGLMKINSLTPSNHIWCLKEESVYGCEYPNTKGREMQGEGSAWFVYCYQV